MKKLIKSLLASLVLCTLSNVALADATDGWKEQATDNENSVIYTNAEKNALVTATLADTEGVPVINLAHTISEKFKCTDFDKEDGAEIYTFVCEIDEAVTSMIVTEANDNKYLTLSMTAKDKEGFSAAGEFAKSLLDDDESSFNEADWIQSPSSTETTKIYNNSKNDVQITISHSDTQGLKIEALATMIQPNLNAVNLLKKMKTHFHLLVKMAILQLKVL